MHSVQNRLIFSLLTFSLLKFWSFRFFSSWGFSLVEKFQWVKAPRGLIVFALWFKTLVTSLNTANSQLLNKNNMFIKSSKIIYNKFASQIIISWGKPQVKAKACTQNYMENNNDNFLCTSSTQFQSHIRAYFILFFIFLYDNSRLNL